MAEFVEFLATQDLPRPTKVLDVGSYDVNGSYRRFFDGPNWSYRGLDVEPGPGVDIVVDQPYRWSGVASNSFDVIVSGQAFEHIEFPWVTIHEVRRVLRPGGWCCLVVPSAGPEHRFPIDCWRFYPDGLTALARWADLEVQRVHTWWEPEGWADGSDEWRDSILVVRKPDQRGLRRLRSGAKRILLRGAMSLQAGRRTELPSQP
jgi:SAM-dependent methyltransferase